MNLPDATILTSGEHAAFTADPYRDHAVQLEIDGTPQSHLDLAQPDELHFDYVRRIGHVIDCCAPAGSPITALHLGGGALTLPRYIAATRRGSSQQVIEIHGDLVDYVRTAFPLPKHARIRIRRGDARDRLAKLPAGMHGTTDIVVADIFAGAQTPAHVTTREFYALLRPLLAPNGLVAVNAADGAGMEFVRSQLATLRSLFLHVAAIGEPQVLAGKRFGNVLLLASDADDGWQWLPRTVTQGPFPARLLEGSEVAEFVRGARPVTDAHAKASPKPPENVFGVSS
jgi:spermidine synthase